MAYDATNQQLNGILIQLSKSLLQYLSEASPWVQSESDESGRLVNSAAASQRDDVGAIARFLNSREHFIDFGTFPTEYTDLQFLALESMLGSSINGQRQICQSIEQTYAAVDPGDTTALVLLAGILANEKQLLQTLEEAASATA